MLKKLLARKKEWIILGLIVILLSIFVYSKDPFNGPILPCIFNKITGLYCPGCGMTRAVNSVFNFKFYQAFIFNPLIFIMPPMLGVYYYLGHIKKPQLAKIVLILMLVVALGYGVLRNLVFIFDWQLNYKGF